MRVAYGRFRYSRTLGNPYFQYDSDCVFYALSIGNNNGAEECNLGMVIAKSDLPQLRTCPI
jgi:hypothetical protein